MAIPLLQAQVDHSTERQVRGILLFLAIAIPVAMASPWFWVLVAMAWSASPVTYQNHDGSLQHATIGPKSAWPAWALKPEGSEFRVKSWFGPSATSSGNGMGDFTVKQEPRAAAAAYVEKLREGGWDIETGRFKASLPVIPPRTLVQCRVRAVRGAHVIVAAFEMAPEAGKGSLFWVEAPVPGSWSHPHGTVVGLC